MRNRLFSACVLLMLLAVARPAFSQDAWVDRTTSYLAQTDDNSPTVMYSIPIDVLKVAIVEATMVAVSPDFTSGAVQSDTALFTRNVGNLLRVFQNFGGALTNWGAPQPTYSLVANTTTQSIDVVVTGKTATTVRWYLSIRYRITT